MYLICVMIEKVRFSGRTEHVFKRNVLGIAFDRNVKKCALIPVALFKDSTMSRYKI
jgi:hypothetical protein